MRPDKLFFDVRSLINNFPKGYSFTKEELAKQFKVEQHLISHILQRLNVEGLVTQPRHHDPIKWSGGRHVDPYVPDQYTRTEKPVTPKKPLKNLLINELQIYIGQKVKKASGKPFKSRLHEATVEAIVNHPITQRPSFLLVEDQTVVEAGQCVAIDEA